ncbi:MAG TPA: M64 family metallopeptidase [Prolixibacteraceae bacterium]|nr:M64 family metallopeptidase [Prolixibacteraceae bacterium]
MNQKFLLILFLFPFLTTGQNFDTYFIDKQMRFDFILAGNDKEATVYPEQIKMEPFWAGPKNNLIAPFNYGTYRFRVFDMDSGELIFSKGFSTLFQEWQTTAEAKETGKTFYQAALFPFPQQKVKLEICARQWEGNFRTIYSTIIDPENYFILQETHEPIESVTIVKNGKPDNKVDITILAEGYTTEEMDKFIEDSKRVSGFLFDAEPFKTEYKKFNVTAVFTPSLESGTDVPGEGIYRKTALNSSFYTFDLPRYLTTTDMKSVYDAAAVVPTDHIYVLVNSDRYGGGGFYNFLSVCTADDELTEPVFVHEFGHGFAGLGDEYYTSTVAYEDYYNLEIEPWEPNLTTLNNFSSKWETAIHDTIPVPTPREPAYKDVTGVFEGGGYINEGIYSPFMNCRMKSNNAKGFCPVCTGAIKKVIQYYAE